jgi:CPA1 family monovalent cation:H+ antiporter
VWETVVFVLNGVLFMLIGLELPVVVRSLPPALTAQAPKLALLVLATIILVRFLWMFGSSYLPRLLSRKLRNEMPPWQHTSLIAWTGMRGADSLAGALAIPFLLPNGQPFPGRNLILLLTFGVIFGTLVLQGLSLSPLIRWLRVVDDHASEKEERFARLKANEAAMARLDEMKTSRHGGRDIIERLRAEYTDRIRQLRNQTSDEESTTGLFSPDFERVAREALETERQTVIQLRNEEQLDSQAFRRIQRDIDLAEARLQRPSEK